MTKTQTIMTAIFSSVLTAVVLCGAGYYIMESRIIPDPISPLGVHATASNGTDGCVLATGSFSSGTEALFYLDSQSGRLSAGLLARGVPSFIKTWTRNIKADLTTSLTELKIPVPAVPKFVMVSGESDIRQVGAGEMNKVSNAMIYIAEIQTGLVLVYGLPNVGDRDLEIHGGEITFWTFARLNNGTGELIRNAVVPAPAAPPVMAPADQAIKGVGYRR